MFFCYSEFSHMYVLGEGLVNGYDLDFSRFNCVWVVCIGMVEFEIQAEVVRVVLETVVGVDGYHVMVVSDGELVRAEFGGGQLESDDLRTLVSGFDIEYKDLWYEVTLQGVDLDSREVLFSVE